MKLMIEIKPHKVDFVLDLLKNMPFVKITYLDKKDTKEKAGE